MKIIHFFSLINTQAKMSLKAEASKFVLSYLWWVIEPLLFITTFWFVFDALLGRARPNYIIFLFTGKIPFQWFSKSIQSASNSIVQNKGLICSTHIPNILFPYASVQEALYKQWVVFLVLFAVLFINGYSPELNWLFIIPLIFVQYLMILFCSIIGALCVSFVHDLKLVINMFMLFLMFSSGVFWDVNSIPIGKRHLILTLNPLAFILDGYRQVFIDSSCYDFRYLLTLGLILIILIVAIHFLMYKLDKTVTMKVMNS